MSLGMLLLLQGTPSTGSSEGVRVEYVAVFLAVFFPGALVAFNHAYLQALPGIATLRIYCAGIWHNAVFCALCTWAMFLLPFIVSPFYIYGQSPMVLDVSPTSPLSGYLSPREIIFSLDGIHIQTAQEWMDVIDLLTKQAFKDLDSSGESREKNRIGYCVPNSLIEESAKIQLNGNQTTCPKELIAFEPMSCLNSTTSDNGSYKSNYQNIRETVQCLNAKDIVKLERCGFSSAKAPIQSNGCLCSADESCFTPVQLPQSAWVEITFAKPSSLECQNHQERIIPHNKNPNIREGKCIQSLVFTGDVLSMAHSVRLTSYQPRWSIDFAVGLPNLMEKLLTCAFHVSVILALLNSLPVFFLDGEAILEGVLNHINFLSQRRKRHILQCCLLAGTVISIIYVLRMFRFMFVHKMICFSFVSSLSLARLGLIKSAELSVCCALLYLMLGAWLKIFVRKRQAKKAGMSFS